MARGFFTTLLRFGYMYILLCIMGILKNEFEAGRWEPLNRFEYVPFIGRPVGCAYTNERKNRNRELTVGFRRG